MEKLKKLPGVRPIYHFLWAWLGSRLHEAPSKKIFVIGVTGTKGKTTTLELINAILEAAHKKTAILSSLRIKIGETSEKNPTGNSMPGRAQVQRFLKKAVKARCNYALVEVTSEGVAQHRHRFIEWNIGAITNLAPEHIESHGSFENYRAAKLEFLKYVFERGGKVFINRMDKNAPFFIDELAKPVKKKRHGAQAVAYSREDEWLRNYLPFAKPARATAEASTFSSKFLLSKFNEENIAAAVAIARQIGIADATIAEALNEFRGVPGRMEFVTRGPYTAIVDYAHTPDSLEAAYKAAKPEPTAQNGEPHLICVLGAAGGGRDKWKRPELGRIAAEYCDEIVLTNEDPYNEDPMTIIKEVRAGILGGDPDLSNVYEVIDRREAIRKAVELAVPGDVVIGTGKGSEDWIHIAGGKKMPWNERKEFEEALQEKHLRGGSPAVVPAEVGV